MEPPETLPVELARSRAAAAAELLARDPRVRLVFLFGSAADPDARQVGDVDLAIWCQPPLEPFDRFRLADELELALGGPVDLVVLNRAPVVLAAEVASTGRCLFARDPDEELEYRCRARAQYWDFKPYLDEQWRLIGERLAARTHGSQG